jgi:hypothetical protein
MTENKNQRTLFGAVIIAALVGGLVCCQTLKWPEVGTAWLCKSSWTWDKKDGTSVPVSVESTGMRTESTVSSTGFVAIGEARWDETSESTYRIDGVEMCGTRTSTKTTPANDAAREFEREHGKSLNDNTKQFDFCVEITSRTENQFTYDDKPDGRTFTCTRL